MCPFWAKLFPAKALWGHWVENAFQLFAKLVLKIRALLANNKQLALQQLLFNNLALIFPELTPVRIIIVYFELLRDLFEDLFVLFLLAFSPEKRDIFCLRGEDAVRDCIRIKLIVARHIVDLDHPGYVAGQKLIYLLESTCRILVLAKDFDHFIVFISKYRGRVLLDRC